MGDLPPLSIVVPNYNNGATLGRTLQSLVDQAYPRLEIVVIDGGSTDGSVEVIRQYERHLAYWVSEPDRGQSHAINKGFARCTGEVLNWLCSDDYLLPGALRYVGEFFAAHPEVDVLAGRTRTVDERTGAERLSLMPKAGWIASMPCRNPIAQPSCFYRRSLLDRPGPLDESLELVMDFELWTYFVREKRARWAVVPEVLATFVMSGTNKTSVAGLAVAAEHERVYGKYVPERVPLPAIYRRMVLPAARWHAARRSGWTLAAYALAKLPFCLATWPFYGWRRPLYLNLGV